MFSIFDRFSPEKLKPHLKMAVNRFGILNGKKAALIKKEKREIAKLLSDEKEEKARIKVEHIIRSDFTIEAYEILELLCELLHERMKLLVAEEECPPDLDEAVCTLIYCANRTECPEITEISKQLKMKYGKEFYERASANQAGCVNERVVHKLSVQPPSAYLIQQYLMKLAEEHEVDWTPTDLGISEDQMMTTAAPAPRGFSVPVGGGSGISDPYYHQSESSLGDPDEVFPPVPSQAVQQTTQPQPQDYNAGFKAGFAAAQDNKPTSGGGGGGVPVARVVGALPEKNVVTVEAEELGGDNTQPELPMASPQPLKIDPALELDDIVAGQLPVPPSAEPVRRNTNNDDDGGGGGGGLELPEAPASNRDSTGMSVEDMQARLNGLGSTVVSPPADQPTPTDYDSLMNRFNSLKT